MFQRKLYTRKTVSHDMQNYFYAMLDRLLKKKNKRFLEKKNLRKK